MTFKLEKTNIRMGVWKGRRIINYS